MPGSWIASWANISVNNDHSPTDKVKRASVRERYEQTTSFSPPSTREGLHSLNYTGPLYLMVRTHFFSRNSAQIARKIPATFIDQLLEVLNANFSRNSAQI